MKRLYILIYLLVAAFVLKAQVPTGYYDNATGLTGDELKTALHNIIDNHTTITYAQVWNAFQSTDLKSNGKIWDMYSDIPNGTPPYEYTYGQNQCGEYDSEGDCYNREHSWPKSWFTGDENSVPGRDLHHIFPTDGYVNQQRSNNPFGEVQTATQTFQNGSKLGNCKSSLGYSGTVYEPIDEYKGDFARAYFYMSVRYYSEDSDWASSDMTTKSELKSWAMTMLLRWNKEDPVSQKEINRNNAIYDIQHNRNPFIDNPEYADMIWDPNWSSTYQIAVAANPVAGGNVSLTATVSDNVSIDFSQQGYSNEAVISNATIDDNVSVAFNKGTNNSNSPKYYTSGSAIRCYGGNYFTVSTTYGSIKKIILTYGSSDGSNEITTNGGSFSTNTWTGNASSVKFTIGGTSGNRRIKAIAVTYSHEGDPANQATCINGSTATLTATPNTGYHFVNWTKGGTVVSTDASLNLTVNENATYQANFEINTYNISVAANSTTGGSVCIGDAPTPTSQKVSIDLSNQGLSNEQNMNGTDISIDDNVKVVFSTNTGSNPPKYYTNGTAVRCYGGNQFVVSTTSGSITKITLTYGSSDGSNAITTNVNTFNSPNWTGSATSVTFTIGGTSGNRRIKEIEVTYSGGAPTPVTQATLNYGTTATITATPKAGYSFVNWTKNNVHISGNATYNFAVTDDADYVANFMNNTVSANTTVAALTLNGTVTVNSGKILTVTGAITQPEGSTIVLNNSAQLVNNTSGITGKVKKNVTQWVTSPSINGWHAISTPVNNANFNNVANLTSSTYNVYRLNEPDLLWENSQDVAGGHSFSTFDNGRGYLYRKGDNTAIEFNGTLNSSDVSYPLTYTSSVTKGFHLIGNPYTHNIYKGAGAAIPNTYLEEGFYTLSSAGGWVAGTDHSTSIAPCQAILVQARSTVTNNNLIMTNTTATGVSKDFDDNIMFTVSNSNYEDVAYAIFKEGHGLNKVDHRNADIQKLYIQHNGEDFAIANIDEYDRVFNLNLHAATMGKYTMKIKATGDFSYLHLIDNITGEDVDLLIDDEYSFVCASSDQDNRFIVKFKYQSSDNSQDDIFAYQNGNEIVVDGVGDLQIFDITGRLISTQYVNGLEMIGKPSQTGVYIIRLVGENVKTQKIVVK